MNQNKYIIWLTTQKYYQSIFIRTKSKIEKNHAFTSTSKENGALLSLHNHTQIQYCIL